MTSFRLARCTYTILKTFNYENLDYLFRTYFGHLHHIGPRSRHSLAKNHRR